MTKAFFLTPLLAVLLFVTGCETTSTSFNSQARTAMIAAIQAEVPGDYFIGRRFYKSDYKFWGYVRSPRQPWSSAKLVMLNENQMITPDRQKWQIGSDNGHEYKLRGYFSGDTVYEPASNRFYPEFVLSGMELINTNPGPIFRGREALNPSHRGIESAF